MNVTCNFISAKGASEVSLGCVVNDATGEIELDVDLSPEELEGVERTYVVHRGHEYEVALIPGQGIRLVDPANFSKATR